MNKNYRNLEKEIHISYILKQLRVVKNIVKEGLTQDQWKRAFAKYSLISYMTSEDDGQKIMEHREMKNLAERELLNDEKLDSKDKQSKQSSSPATAKGSSDKTLPLNKLDESDQQLKKNVSFMSVASSSKDSEF